MAKNRESIALQSGGVSPAAMLRFVIIYGLVWSCMQFAFSQVLGVQGERLSSEMWAQDIRGRDPKNTAIKGLLFTQESYVVETKLAWPQLERAEGVTIYKITPDGKGMVASYSAETAESGPNGWVLYNVEVIEPDSFSYTRHERLEIDLRQNLDTFKTYDEDAKTSEIALPELLETIKRLEQTGTNVEGLETEFFGRFAYSGSILVMGILGLALTMRTDNIYIGVVLSLVLTFFFYAANSLFSTMGQAGSLPPLIAAWLANISFTALALLYIFSRVIMASLRRS